MATVSEAWVQSSSGQAYIIFDPLNPTAESFYASDSYSYIGYGYKSLILFEDVNVPAYANVQSARVRFHCATITDWINTGLICNANVSLIDSAVPVMPTDCAEYNALSKTTPVAWNGVPAWTEGEYYYTADLTDIVQAILDRGDWTLGNSMLMAIEDNGSTYGAHRAARGYALTHPLEAPYDRIELEITWEIPGAPTSDFSASPVSGPESLTVQFAAEPTGSVTDYLWNFGDGSPTSTTKNPSHTYNLAGSYTVSLTVAGYGGSDIETKTDYINVVSLAYALPPAGIVLPQTASQALDTDPSPSDMISISAPIYDVYGNVLFQLDMDRSDMQSAFRRISRTATLDGGCVVFDGGYSESDRTLTIAAADISIEQEQTIRRLFKTYSALIVTCGEGAFLCAVDSVKSTNGQLLMTLLVQGGLSQ